MKKNVLVIMIICLTGNATGIFAQQKTSDEDRKARFEKFKTEREEFISKAMKLTDDEKTVFWPLCNELQMKKFELNKTLRDEMRKIGQAQKANQTVTEADYKKVIELSSRIKVQEAQLEQEYVNKFLQVIPAEKVFLYRQSEQNFGEKMMQNRTDRAQRLSDNAHKREEKAKLRMEKAKLRMEKAQLRAEKLKKQSREERQRRYRGV